MPIKVQNQQIEQFVFSGGECHVNIDNIELTSPINVEAKLLNSDDLMSLLLTVDAVRRSAPKSTLNIAIPYFPYARQDRVCNPGEAFSLEVACKLINDLEADQVTVLDPHSAVTTDRLNNVVEVTQAEIIEKSQLATFIKSKQLLLVAPDQGAKLKTEQLAEALNSEAVYCTKKRDPKTRAIVETKLPKGVESRDLILIDDICDGGRTFIELAKACKEAGCGDLYLYVTHGIFSRGLESHRPHIKGVFCQHTFLPKEQIDSEFLTVLEEVQNEN